MAIMKSIIDGNEAAARWYEYMRPARRDNDQMPRRVHTDPEKRALTQELNAFVDRLQFGYAPASKQQATNVCERCGGPLRDGARLARSIYPAHGERIDLYRCGEC